MKKINETQMEEGLEKNFVSKSIHDLALELDREHTNRENDDYGDDDSFSEDGDGFKTTSGFTDTGSVTGSSVTASTLHGQVGYMKRNIEQTTYMTRIVSVLIVLIGAIASLSFLYLGISNAKDDQINLFERRSVDVTQQIQSSWKDYEQATLWIHESCRNWRSTNMTRKDFRILYNYMIASDEEGDGLEFFAAEWIPNVTHVERAALEQQAYQDWDWYKPEGPPYSGFKGIEPNPAAVNDPTAPKMAFQNRSEQEWYFPMQFMEPPENLGAKGHLDLYSVPNLKPAIIEALETKKPALTAPFVLIHETKDFGNSVVLFHPGLQTLPPSLEGGVESDFEHRTTGDLSNMVIKINDLLIRASRNQGVSLAAYLYDFTVTDQTNGEEPPMVLGGIEVNVDNLDIESENGSGPTLSFPEKTYDELIEQYGSGNSDENNKKKHESGFLSMFHKIDDLFYEETVQVESRTWRIVVVPIDDTYVPDLRFILLSGSMIFVASVLLSCWMIYKLNQQIKLHHIVTKAAAESAIVSNLFPKAVRDRMVQDAAAQQRQNAAQSKATSASATTWKNGGGDGLRRSTDLASKLNTYLTSEGIFGSKPIAELHPYTTVM